MSRRVRSRMRVQVCPQCLEGHGLCSLGDAVPDWGGMNWQQACLVCGWEGWMSEVRVKETDLR